MCKEIPPSILVLCTSINREDYFTAVLTSGSAHNKPKWFLTSGKDSNRDCQLILFSGFRRTVASMMYTMKFGPLHNPRYHTNQMSVLQRLHCDSQTF